MDKEWIASVRTIEEARDFILKVEICGILGRSKTMPTLWEAVDAPDKVPGATGWGDKMGYVWGWKNELPARYPDEIFYGKIKSGAVLCSMNKLRELFIANHKPISELSEIASKLFSTIKQNLANNKELKDMCGLKGKTNKTIYDKALLELQLTFNIVRVNRIDTDGDTWTLFEKQYPQFP